ncbi:unnamed protein product [Caenorhabditis bovis]|uniref:Uncharacterized protein n=1 Tax=Caenorhabditis bovis TaxID=2654633 RepID=A0A8S1EE13_9PELO|nr:unnamed protein product [Caenorhabditis bovis]
MSRRGHLVVFLLILWLFFFWSLPRVTKYGSESLIERVSMLENVSEVKIGGKWIVVTSISTPTDNIKRLASFNDWNLVVVGDSKTPADWHLDGVHFLSIDLQKSFGLGLPANLPYNSYTRKNVGYLYAISNGAQWIYDTDDDYKPFGLGLNQFQFADVVSSVVYYPKNSTDFKHRLFNPYQFYGSREMWPRGFPLEYLKEHTNGDETMGLCSMVPTPAVQQGLAHHDPDVDAIYRLLRADPKSGLNERFNKFAPPITLSVGTYAPWNSQNTLFHKSAFHTMFLPTSVPFRTTDVWRSYYAQRILHLSGLTVGFTPVNAIQYRNANDYLKDFHDELQVYQDAGRIVNEIHKWKCDSGDVPRCMIDLADRFVELKPWEPTDAQLIRQWIKDLETIGHTFPAINSIDRSAYEISRNESSRLVNCRRIGLQLWLDDSRRASQKIAYWSDIDEWCRLANYTGFRNSLPSPKQLAEQHSKNPILTAHSNNVLVVVSNYAWKWAIGLIQRMYSPYFGAVIFCGSYYPDAYRSTDRGFPKPLRPFIYVHMNPAEMHNGYFGYHCLTLTKELMLANVGGYLVVADDAVLNVWQRIDFSRVFHLTGVAYIDDDLWWNEEEFGLDAALRIVNDVNGTDDDEIRNVWKQYETGLRKFGYINGSMSAFDDLLQGKSRSISDVYYVPSDHIDYFARLMRIFYRHQLFLELAVNRFLRSIRHQTSRELTNNYMWSNRREWAEVYNSSVVAIHPIKLSKFAEPNANRKKFCGTILQTMHNVLIRDLHNYTMKGNSDRDYLNG